MSVSVSFPFDDCAGADQPRRLFPGAHDRRAIWGGVYEPAPQEWYREEDWAAAALLITLRRRGLVQAETRFWDPWAGSGSTVGAVRAAGHVCHASDIVDRGCARPWHQADFLGLAEGAGGSIIGNPPYAGIREHIDQALALTDRLVCVLVASNLPYGHREWFSARPLVLECRTSPRLNCPPGHKRLPNNGGGRMMYSWLVFDRAARPCGGAWMHDYAIRPDLVEDNPK